MLSSGLPLVTSHWVGQFHERDMSVLESLLSEGMQSRMIHGYQFVVSSLYSPLSLPESPPGVGGRADEHKLFGSHLFLMFWKT